MPRLAIIGTGKMGRAIAQLARERGWQVVAEIGQAGNENGRGITRESLQGADVAIEFTAPDAAVANVLACVAAGCPVVVGTTGWYDRLPEIAAHVEREGGSVLWAANFSIGVQLFLMIAEQAGRLLRDASGFDAHLVETHHSAKKDAPSGTALAIMQAAGGALGRPIPATSIRTGSVPGTHELIFDAPFEQIRLTHEARDRRVFADGALQGAAWLVREPRRGVFTMRDVLAQDMEKAS